LIEKLEHFRDIGGGIGIIGIKHEYEVGSDLFKSGSDCPALAPSGLSDNPGSLFLGDLGGLVSAAIINYQNLNAVPCLLQGLLRYFVNDLADCPGFIKRGKYMETLPLFILASL
jgi:hypothetical protein